MSLLLLLSISVAVNRVEADTAVVRAIPPEVTVPSVGQRFTLNITIADVADLYGYEVKVYYNSTQLDALWNVLPSDHFMRPLAGGTFFVVKNSSDNAYNATHKFAWFGGSLLAPELPRAGSGTLFQIVFNATAKGGPYSVYINYPGNPYPAKLADSSSPPNTIPCTAEHSYITVIPEFPASLFIVVLMAATLVAVTFGRTAWLRKRRSSFIAD